jgi:hypothetical protein
VVLIARSWSLRSWLTDSSWLGISPVIVPQIAASRVDAVEQGYGPGDMKAPQVLEWFEANRPQSDDLKTESGERHHGAYLRLSKASAPERWAEVESNPFLVRLHVDGGFSLNWRVGDGAQLSDHDLVVILRRYLDVAIEYLRQLPTPVKRGFLRGTVVEFDIDGEKLVMGKRGVATGVPNDLFDS